MTPAMDVAPVWTGLLAGVFTDVAWLMRPEASVPADEAWLSAGESARAAGLVVPVRRCGWLLRRWAAKEALGALLGESVPPRRDVEIANRDDGAPEVLWSGDRLPVALSLTDRAGWTGCTLAPGGVAVGCDLELIEPRTAAFVGDWFTPAEQRFVARSPDSALAANLVWSAKESALKVLGEGLRRPTRSVEVHLPLATGAGTGGFSPLHVTLAEGGCLSGWWRRLGPYVFTLAVGSPALPAAPQFLGGPTPT